MSPVRMSKIESVTRAVLEYKDAINRHDVEGMMKLISDDCLFESADGPKGRELTGKAEITQYWEEYFRVRPGVQMTGEEVFGLGMRCVMRWRSEWEDDGGMRQVRGVDIFHFKDGMIRKQYSYVKGDV